MASKPRMANLKKAVKEISNELENELKYRAPVDKGYLEDSIEVDYHGAEIDVKMLEYGVYQHYGFRHRGGGMVTKHKGWADPIFDILEDQEAFIRWAIEKDIDQVIDQQNQTR